MVHISDYQWTSRAQDPCYQYIPLCSCKTWWKSGIWAVKTRIDEIRCQKSSQKPSILWQLVSAIGLEIRYEAWGAFDAEIVAEGDQDEQWLEPQSK